MVTKEGNKNSLFGNLLCFTSNEMITKIKNIYRIKYTIKKIHLVYLFIKYMWTYSNNQNVYMVISRTTCTLDTLI